MQTKSGSDSFHGPYCTVREAAEYARCCQVTIRRWVRRGLIKATRPGGIRLRISVASLQRLLAEES